MSGTALDWSDEEIDQAVITLRLLSDHTRLAILAMLENTEMSVGAMAEVLDRPVPAVSQHLGKLRAAKVVTTRRVGTNVFYGQPDEHIGALVRNILQYASKIS